MPCRSSATTIAGSASAGHAKHGLITFYAVTPNEGAQLFTVRPNGHDLRQITHGPGEAVNAEEMSAGRLLPEGLVEGCRVLRDVAKDEVLAYDDVELPPDRLADRLRAEQYRHFFGDTWLEEVVGVAASSS